MGKSNNFPQSGLDELDHGFVADTISSLRELRDLGKPQTDQELVDRIDLYFEFCQRKKMRPGIESLSAALGVSRMTLYNWSNGYGCSEFRMEAVNQAKALIYAFLEQSALQGRLSPPTAIFLMKNWMNYRDSIGLEMATPEGRNVPVQSADQIAERYKGYAELDEPEETQL